MSTTLLAVDDSVTMRKVLEIAFGSDDFRLVSAESADAALKKARSQPPQIAVVDVTLPDQDGYALCKSLKSEMPGVLVVLMASKQGPYDAARGSAAGVDDYIEKPFDTQALLDKVRKVVQAKPVAPPAAQVSAPAPATVARPAAPATTLEPSAGVRPTPSPLTSGAALSGAPPFGTRPTAPSLGARGTQIFPGGGPPPDRPSQQAPQPGERISQIAPERTSQIAPERTSQVAPERGAPSTTTAEYRNAPLERTQTAPVMRPVVPVAPPGPPARAAASTTPQMTMSAPQAGTTETTTPDGVRPAAAAMSVPALEPPAKLATGPSPSAAAVPEIGVQINGQLSEKLAGLGLTEAQAQAVLALSREVVERIVWEVVPTLAETMIKEEIRRLTKEA